MSFYTISHWEADEWTDEMEAIAKDKFGPMIMSVGASSVDFVQTGDKTMSRDGAVIRIRTSSPYTCMMSCWITMGVSM